VIEAISTWTASPRTSRGGTVRSAHLGRAVHFSLHWIDETTQDRWRGEYGDGVASGSMFQADEIENADGQIDPRVEIWFEPAGLLQVGWHSDPADPTSWNRHTVSTEGTWGWLDRRTGELQILDEQMATLGLRDYNLLEAMAARYLELTS
jgi:hypothetical protein